MTDARAIAAGLSAGDVRVVQALTGHFTRAVEYSGNAALRLLRKRPELLERSFDEHDRRTYRLTPLGLEVLAELRGGKGCTTK